MFEFKTSDNKVRKISRKDKKVLDKALNKTFKKYGETLKKLHNK
jgi:hypothetical protein